MKRKASIFRFLCGAAGIFCLVLLLAIFGALIVSGLPALSWDFIVQEARSFGSEGGVGYQIFGSILLVMGTALLTSILAMGTALFLSELIRKEALKRRIELALQVMNGIPSIAFGIFGLILFVDLLGFGVSWSSGVFVLSTMILPMTVLSTYHRIQAITAEEKRTAFSLGMTRWEWIRKGVLGRGFQGMSTGLMLGLARAIGETAPIMFVATVFSGVAFPASFQDPVVSLPTHILELAQQASNEAALQKAWGASLVLVVLVMLLSGSALFFRKRGEAWEG